MTWWDAFAVIGLVGEFFSLLGLVVILLGPKLDPVPTDESNPLEALGEEMRGSG